MAIFCKQSDVSSDDVSSDRKVVSERLELRRRIQICRYCNPFLSAPTPSQDEKRNTKKQSKKESPFAFSFSDPKLSFFGDLGFPSVILVKKSLKAPCLSSKMVY